MDLLLTQWSLGVSLSLGSLDLASAAQAEHKCAVLLLGVSCVLPRLLTLFTQFSSFYPQRAPVSSLPSAVCEPQQHVTGT